MQSGRLTSSVSKRNPFRSYFRFLCHTEQRKRWDREAKIAKLDLSTVARDLLDEWAERQRLERERPQQSSK